MDRRSITVFGRSAAAGQFPRGIRDEGCRSGTGDFVFSRTVFDGIVEMLQALQTSGKRLAVATSKHQTTAVRILEHFGLEKYFEVIGGDDPTSSRNTKAKVVAHVLKEMHVAPQDAVMIGDRKYDIEGAHALGVQAVGVLYGYGSAEEFAACGADAVVKTPQDVAELFR